MKKYERVAARILDLIDTGTLKTADRVPSLRNMANQMKMSVMTVLEGYERLETRGIIESKPQSGYYVRPKHLWFSGLGSRLPEAHTEQIKLYTDQVRISPAIKKLLSDSWQDDFIPLGAGIPAADFFPGEELSKRMARAVRGNYHQANSYHFGTGYNSLQVSLSRFMLNSGSTVNPKEIIITTGATQALMLALRAVTAPGDPVLVESPGYYGFYTMLNFLNLKAFEVPSNPQQGLSISALEAALSGRVNFACILLSSCFCNPTGASMPETAKKELIKLCVQYDLPIIEDDVFGETAHNHRRPRPLKASNNEQVIYISSMGKILAPGYRIGWIAGGKYQHDIEKSHNMGVFAINSPCQLAVDAYLRDGGMSRHLRRLQTRYDKSVRFFQTHIADCFPEGTRTSHPEGGHFIWIKLPDGCDSVCVTEKAAQHKISVAPGIIFSSRNLYADYIRINCAFNWNEQLEQAIALLGKIVDEARGKK